MPLLSLFLISAVSVLLMLVSFYSTLFAQAAKSSTDNQQTNPSLTQDIKTSLTSADLHQALSDFQRALDSRWSYRYANQANFAVAIKSLRKKIDGGISTNDFGIELQKIIALGIDGHSSIIGYTIAGKSLPFLIETSGNRFVAIKSDRTGFLAVGFPYLNKIDGKSVSDWCAAASILVPKGSPQYILRHCLSRLRSLDYMRELMKLPKKNTVKVELADKNNKGRKSLILPVAEQLPDYGIWPASGSRIMEGNIGYLRLPNMDQKAVTEIREWLPKFRDTRGLIVDVRDNGGGIRDPMRLLYSYLSAPKDPPIVFTAAAYRLHPEHKEDHLTPRFMYRATAREWTEKERLAVAQFAKTFKAKWQLPAGQFSEWHYMVLSRMESTHIYFYNKPVIILMNSKCFSATDIFLAGLRELKNVTLLGEASAGGSAFAKIVNLGATPFRLRIASMVSFQADGILFDGNGIRPDVVVSATPEYYIGSSDNVLEKALSLLKMK